MDSSRRRSHFLPRTRDGRVAVVAFLALFALAIPPVTHTLWNRAEPWIAGLLALYVTLVLLPHPLGMHGAIWSLLVNAAAALNVSAVTAPPSPETIERVHGEIERFVYGREE